MSLRLDAAESAAERRARGPSFRAARSAAAVGWNARPEADSVRASREHVSPGFLSSIAKAPDQSHASKDLFVRQAYERTSSRQTKIQSRTEAVHQHRLTKATDSPVWETAHGHTNAATQTQWASPRRAEAARPQS